MMRGLTRKKGIPMYQIWVKVNLSELPRIEKFIFTASKRILIKKHPLGNVCLRDCSCGAFNTYYVVTFPFHYEFRDVREVQWFMGRGLL